MPEFAHAASWSFFGPVISSACNCNFPVSGNGITTPTSAPAWGCILSTLQNLLSLAVSLATVIIVLFIMLAGFTYMTSGGNPEKRQLANKRIMNAVLGLLITLGAYLLVDSVMKVIYDPSNLKDFGPWNAILANTTGTAADCLAPVNPPPIAGLSNANANGGTGGPPANTTPAVTTPGASGSSGLNISAAVNYLNSNVHQGPPGTGNCLHVVALALSAGGVNLQCGAPPGHSGYAGYCNSSLSALNFSPLGSSDSSPQPGDLLVIQNSGGSQIGHITMWTGSAWVSDFIQPSFESPGGNPYGSAGYNPQYWRP